MGEPLTRAELEAGYAQPYRRWLPRLYALNRVRELLFLTAALWVLGAVWDPGLVLADVATVLVAVWTVWVTLAGVRIIRARTAEWRGPERSELARIRERRPHAGDADPTVAHDEYAVGVGDRGELITWRFRPLAAYEQTEAGEALLRGTPRYAAAEAGRTAHDARDAGLAAEQLSDAQAAAADRERSAIARLHADLAALRERRELDAETASTAAALRGVTGQGPR
jgi:hypothetical protein